MADFAQRLAWHGRLAWRASAVGIAVGAAGGSLLDLVLSVRGAWLPGAVAAGAAALALLCMAVAPARPLPATDLDVGPALEKVGTADQVAHGLARAALILAAFAVGLAAAGLAKLGR
ncbi:MAG TPA: hypothetical protein VM327_01820 [Candidatus Thermoplasmatota archaeon]|nr:hypothetical protein [Candidatus Thermoplasmatota archaeon]